MVNVVYAQTPSPQPLSRLGERGFMWHFLRRVEQLPYFFAFTPRASQNPLVNAP